MKVVITSSCYRPTVEDWITELKLDFPDHDFVPATNEVEQKREIRDADVYFGFPQDEVFAEARQLKLIQRSGTGMDALMRTPLLVASDVPVANTRGPHANSMADHTLGMMLILAHRFRDLGEQQKAHEWIPRGKRSIELNGSTLGILGLGDVGSAVARRAHGFGMKVYAVDKYPKPQWYRQSEVREVWTPERLDDLLEMSDWFVVAAPLTVETRGTVDRRRIGLLKDSAHLIVISRANIIDDDALYERLRNGTIAGAGLDVVAQRPPDDIWDMPNVVLSPHCSYQTPDCFEGRRQIFKENLRRLGNNEPLICIVNKQEGF